MLKYAVVALLFISGMARAVPVADVPNPFSTPAVFVVDHGQVLGPDYTALINGISQKFFDATGDELVVVTVDNLDGLTVDDYAEQLFKRLGIGEKGKDNGVLILLSRDDRRVRVEVGYGLESVLNDARAGRLLDENGVPFLKKNEFGRGLYESGRAVATTIAGTSHPVFQIAEPAAWPAQPEVHFGEAPPVQKSGSLLQILGIVTLLFGLIAAGLMLWYGLRCVCSRTRAGKKRALIHSDSAEAALVFMGPIAAGFIGNSEGSIWKGIAAAPIPVALWGLVRLFHRWLSRRADNFHRRCAGCSGKMDYEKSEKAHLTDVQRVEEKAGGMDYEVWRCPACDKVEVADILVTSKARCPKCRHLSMSYHQEIAGSVVTVTKTCLVAACGYVVTKIRSKRRGERAGRGWSFSNQRSSGGRSGGGSSGGGGASRGF